MNFLTEIRIEDMRKTINIIALLCAAAGVGLCVTSCEKYDEVPPIKETTSNRTYYINPPTVMSPTETAEYNAIVAEYESATTNKD